MLFQKLRRYTRRIKPVYIFAVTEAEFFSYANLVDEEVESIEGFLKTVFIVPFESRLARLSRLIRRTYSLELADSAIAATALFTGSTLVTRNVSDFKKIEGLQYKEFR
jgi:predicted nucleic acid-binding protein